MNQIDCSGFPEDIRKEFAVDPATGVGFVTLRGLARLCGVSHNGWGRDGNIFTSAIDEMLTSQGLQQKEGGNIDDLTAAVVIQYYALYAGKRCTLQAQKTLMAFAAIGLRTVIQKSLGWEAPRQLTDKEIVALLVMPVPAPYSPKFEVEFYNHLSRLTGLKANGHLRPNYWAALTKELVYDYMPAGVYEEIKRWQQCTDSNKKTKVHQYMSSSGTEVLMSHLKRLLTFMSGASSLDDLRWLLQQSASKQYQMSLFEPHTLKPQK